MMRLNFRIQHLARGTEARNTVTHHAAQLFMLVKNGDAVTTQTQLVSSRQTGRTCADDGNFFAGRRLPSA